MKNVQISRQLFCYLVEYFFPVEGKIGDDKILEETIQEMIEEKVEKMKKHSDYTKMMKEREDGEIIKSKDRLIIL